MSDLRKEIERLASMFQKEAHAHLNWALDCEHESDEEFFHRIEQRVYEDVAEALRLALQRTAAIDGEP
jgi:phage-related protein